MLVLQTYAKPLKGKMKMGAVVTSIDWTDDICLLKYWKGGVLHEVWNCNVIVTVPLGVLKANKFQVHLR